MYTQVIAVLPFYCVVLGEFDGAPERRQPAPPADRQQEKDDDERLPIHIRDSIYKIQEPCIPLLPPISLFVYRPVLTGAHGCYRQNVQLDHIPNVDGLSLPLSSPSKARMVSASPPTMSRYVESLGAMRIPQEGFFSILLKGPPDLSQKCPTRPGIDGGVRAVRSKEVWLIQEIVDVQPGRET